MFVIDYFYKVPTVDKNDHIEIEGINREDYATDQYRRIAPTIKLTKPTAVLYAGGASISQSENRNASNVPDKYAGTVSYQDSQIFIKEINAYSMHKWIGDMKNNEFVVYASINGNSCASSMYSLYEAERLLNNDEVEEVIIIAEERTSFNTIRIFKEHYIPLTVSDGLAIVRLSKSDNGNNIEITDTKWKYEWNRNPFGVTKKGYLTIDNKTDMVKLHGTGTPANNKAEEVLTTNKDSINYKSKIGHSQGASALLELCMAIDDENAKGDILCVASGLGGFYGSCILHK